MIWNTRGSHNIFKFKHNSYKPLQRHDQPTCFCNKKFVVTCRKTLAI